MSAGALYIVSTPIGNLGDITYRAVETLKSVQGILAEDTRHSRPLLDRYDIRTPVASLREHNERQMIPRLVERLEQGESLALISDAGTPLLSDPGARLVAAAAGRGIAVVPIPGASALLAALVASGLSSDAFTFLGFLERKGAERRRQVGVAAASPHPVVIYEAPSRVGATLGDLASAMGADRPAVVARELTKMHEEIRRGTLAELAEYYRDSPPRGEVVLVIDGATIQTPDPEMLTTLAAELRAEGRSAKEITHALTERGASRNEAYRLAHRTKEPD